ncbi:MAG: oxidoreductase family protein [Thermodesulfobacteriota bacterium]
MKKHPKHPDDITPQWLTFALRQSGVLTNSKVISIKKDNMADGKAWLSSILKIHAEYDIQEKNVPSSFVLKMLSPSKFRRSSYEIDAYEREVKFYSELSQSFPIKLPKFFHAEYGIESNLMLMEDLTYLTPGDQVKGMKQEPVLTTLESLAKVHGTYWQSPILDTLEWMPTTNNIEQGYNENWDSFVELCGYFIDPDGMKIGEKLRPHISWLFKEIASRPKTLTHDDMKADNLLFGEAGTDEAVVLLDWQFAIRSMGATDVARLIGGSELPTERKGRQFEALRYWYDKLLEEGVTNYSGEEAQRDFKLGALSCLIFPVHFHKGIVRAEGRALEYVIAMYSRLFSHVVEIEADSILP